MLDIWSSFALCTPAHRGRLDYKGVAAAAVPTADAGAGTVRSAGYVDALAAQMEGDEARHTRRTTANALFDTGNFREAQPLLEQCLDDHDVVIRLKHAISTSLLSQDMLLKGEQLLRGLCVDMPQFAAAHVWLARNLCRQVTDFRLVHQTAEAVQQARAAVLDCVADKDVVKEAMLVFNTLCTTDQLDDIIPRVAAAYPGLPVERDNTLQLWTEGKAWLATPDPKDLARGLRIFSAIAARKPTDYWAAVLHGGCMLWSGRPAEALPKLTRARQLDESHPHAFVFGAQCLVKLGQPSDAANLVRMMLEADLKLTERDHYEKVGSLLYRDQSVTALLRQVYEGLELCARILPALGRGAELENMCTVAAALWPPLSPHLLRLRKENACLLA